ncbi:hypothetical protein [Eubacterium oxidoreducens]|uniref:Uncharacterized protein n=1 Tax=Eubacterium oxidoreducens TaxID=1732 RepID=A0A1G6CH95_EUBOX|nr:hypothetical protein [Eubacterium oxidoreducens]SDB32122.1 hypothetical protein SAMN02910417_02395 [Eubacterium oxidoreducens]
MMNFGALMKLKGIRDEFAQNHPGVSHFFRDEIMTGLPEGTILEISVTKPGEEKVTSNMKVNEKDLEIFRTLGELSK